MTRHLGTAHAVDVTPWANISPFKNYTFLHLYSYYYYLRRSFVDMFFDVFVSVFIR